MKHNLFLFVIFLGLFSCASNMNDYQDDLSQSNNSREKLYQWFWDGAQQDEFRPSNPGTKSSSYAIDSNIVSFAIPYLIGTRVWEHPVFPNYGGPNAFSPYLWTNTLIFAEGTDVSKLSPIIKLASGATIIRITYADSDKQIITKQVKYAGIADVGVLNFDYQVDIEVLAPNGSSITYAFSGVATGVWLPCVNCPD